MLHAIMLVLAAASVTPARPQVLTPDSTKAVLAQYEKDRVDTREWLESAPSSYFSAVARRDFEDQTVMSVGRAPGNDLRLDDPLLKPNTA
jgi:hypothetical protein